VLFFLYLFGIFLTLHKNIKRFLAYSSISHVGFMLLPLLTPSVEAIESLFFYIFPYMITTFVLWNMLFYITNKNFYNKSKILSNFYFFRKDNFYLSLILTLVFFSLAGISTFIRFFSKIKYFLLQ
jgi:NADH-quinone oxidoreductase subunit N